MDIKCNKCGAGFKVPDSKLPKGKSVSVRCPSCKGKISISLPAGKNAQKGPSQAAAAFGFTEDSDSDDRGTYDASEKPFDFIEEEGETALICESEPLIKEPIKKVLTFMEYHISEASDVRDALKKMRYHLYDMIVVNETFGSRSPDANSLLIYLERLKMKIRREIFVVMLTKRFKTMDHMEAFKKSVNIIVNVNDINHFEKILTRGLSEYNQFYHIYKELVRNISTI